MAAHQADLAIIHIGAPHAGSTRIQTALSASRDHLHAQGVLYPRVLGRTAHIGLAAAMTRLWRRNGPRRALGLASYPALLRHRSHIAKAFAAEFNETRPRMILVSAEQLMADADPRRVKRFFRSYARRIEIVCWLRRQDEALTASWLNTVKLGGTGALRLSRPRCDPFDYAARLRPWMRVFGRHLSIHAYDAHVDPAAEIWGRAGVSGTLQPGAANVSVDSSTLQFLEELNKHIPRHINGEQNPLRGDLDAAIEALPTGVAQPRISEPEAAQIMAHFAKSNRQLARMARTGTDSFFPETTTPEPTPEALTTQDAIAIAAGLWTHKQKQLNRLRSSNVRARPSRNTTQRRPTRKQRAGGPISQDRANLPAPHE